MNLLLAQREQAKEQGRQEERAAIVADIREIALEVAELSKLSRFGGGHSSVAFALETLAKRYEDGEHRKGGG